jgi:hypothetical protein
VLAGDHTVRFGFHLTDITGPGPRSLTRARAEVL